MQGIIANLELVFGLSGLLLVALVPTGLDYKGTEFWIATAATALLVTGFYGTVLWIVRRRQRLLRRELLLEAMNKLATIRDQKLSEIMIRCEMIEPVTPASRAHLARIRLQAEQLWEEVNSVSVTMNVIYREPQRRDERIRYDPIWRPSPEV
jgi:hypothetical protein